ncbi:hypothetical protein HanRHA438_Chr01g0031971 [Helianthus annuus]|nr:hypothetical protein HanRHA438_Chr01g0031971 [Helianthus annuus]
MFILWSKLKHFHIKTCFSILLQNKKIDTRQIETRKIRNLFVFNVLDLKFI